MSITLFDDFFFLNYQNLVFLLDDQYIFSDCLKSGKPSLLVGDVFFHLVCSDCSTSGEEEVERIKMQW